MPTLDLYQDCECNTYLSLVFYFTTYPKHAVGNAEKGFVVQLYDRNVTLFGNKLHVYLGNPSQERETYGNLCIVWTDENAYTCYDGWLWYWYFRQPSYRYLLLSIASFRYRVLTTSSSTAPDPEVSSTFYFSRDVWLYNFLHIHDVITKLFGWHKL